MGRTGVDAQLAAWRKVYVTANRGTLEWMLDRPALRGAFLNTKMNHITGRDFAAADGWKGPQTILGWIQGRGLEALVTHASFFDHEDAGFAKRLDEILADYIATGPTAEEVQRVAASKQLLRQPINVVNKPGNSGMDGLMDIKASKGNPHKLVITLSNLFTAPLATGADFSWKDLMQIGRAHV